MREIYNKEEDARTCTAARKRIHEILDVGGGNWFFLFGLLDYMSEHGYLSYRQVHVLGQMYDETVPIPPSRWDEGMNAAQWKCARYAENRRGTVRELPDGRKRIDRLMA